jgi:hypothetical protein
MYRQLAEIHAITYAQLAECSCWLRSDSTASPFSARAGRPKPIMTPSTIRLASSPPTDFSSQAPPWWQDRHDKPQPHRQARQGGKGAPLECRAQSPRQGDDSFRSMFKEPHDIATQHATSFESIMLRPTRGSREASPSSDKEAPSNLAVQYTQAGVKGGGKRCMQHHQVTMTTAIHDDGHDWEAGGSGVRCTSADARSSKCPARPPMDHFIRLLEEACPNHAYPVRHKLKDCGMMRSFMTSGSLTFGMELEKGPDGSDIVRFPEENAIMMVYGGRHPWGRHHIPSLSHNTPSRCGWGRGG